MSGGPIHPSSIVPQEARKPMNSTPRRSLRRSRKDRMILGVCGGIAEATGLDPAIVRLLAVLLVLSSMGSAMVIYLILALVMPEAPSAPLSQSLSEDARADASQAAEMEAPLGAALPATVEVDRLSGEGGLPTFTPDEVARWDLPGEKTAGAPSAAEDPKPSTASEEAANQT